MTWWEIALWIVGCSIVAGFIWGIGCAVGDLAYRAVAAIIRAHRDRRR